MGWVTITMAMVDVDCNGQFSAHSQPKSIGLVWGLAATRRWVYIDQLNRVNSRNDFGHDESLHVKNQFDPSIHFDRTPTCDGHTQTAGHSQYPR